MKDEELFKAWKSEQYKDQSTEEKMEFVEHLHTFPKYFETIFLAGLKTGRPQWHDLRKDPNDLPPKMLSNSNFSIDVLSDKGEIVCYNFHYCDWFYWRSGSPIAWCEIPTFDKE